MYNWTFVGEGVADDGVNDPVEVTPLQPALFNDSGWLDVFMSSQGSRAAEGEDTVTFDDKALVGNGSDHELLTADEEVALANEITAAFGDLQCALARDRESLEALIRQITEVDYEADIQRSDAIITLFDTLLVYQNLKLNHSRFEKEYEQILNRLVQLFRGAVMDRDFVLNLAANKNHSVTTSQHLKKVLALRNRFVTSNIRLVYHVARRHMDKGMSLEDMVQEGTLGLLRAAIKFDVSVGVRFSTYSFWWIKQAIRQAISKQRSMIRYPVHVTDQVNRVYASIQQHMLETGQKPSLKQLQKRTALSASKIKDLKSLSNFCVSADAAIYEDSGRSIGDDLVYDNTYMEPAAEASRASINNQLEELFSVLNEREQMALRMKYGIGHHKPYSLNEIAPQMGVSRERVRQIIEESLKKIRNRYTGENLND